MLEIPIILFAYNRPSYLRRTLSALMENEGVEMHPLFVYCDGAKEEITDDQREQIKEVRRIAKEADGFKSVKVIISPINRGLVKSITSGVTDILTRYPAVIVMEDDLVTGKYFLRFMRDALIHYEHNSNIISIHGFNHPIHLDTDAPASFFLRGADCWGWATWRRGWALYNHDAQYLYEQIKGQRLARDFNFDNTYPYYKMLKDNIDKESSWAIRWYASAYLLNKLTLYPSKTLVKNIGEEGSNFKTAFEDMMGEEVSNEPVTSFPDSETENREIRYLLSCHFKKAYSLNNRILRGLRYFIKKLK